MRPVRIRFPQGAFASLREHLLRDTRHEAFALLFGRREPVADSAVILVTETHFPGSQDYESRGPAHLRLRRQYVYDRLVHMQQRGEADTVIDVHTHPFSGGGVAFSGQDDADEQAFHRWLTETLDPIHYASLVLSRSDYAARVWERFGDQSESHPARVRTQTVLEQWPCADDPDLSKDRHAALDPKEGFLARSVLALGLDALRRIVSDQEIAVVGVGGLGSAIAENLVHSGFHHLHLVDHDRIETTNLNRIVGASAEDASSNRLKVEAVRDHLLRINPAAKVDAHPCEVEDRELLPVLARCDWILLATDSHASRFATQQIALRFGIPLISVGVNIAVTDGHIQDMSGEVITARWGDGFCLNCLGRVDTTGVAAETVPGMDVVMERRGYVAGRHVKEPAVKTLNAILAARTVDALVNQYTGRQIQPPVLVYEDNQGPRMYADTDSLARRPKDCFHCAC
jgi:molybdopterin-synthase adenylyltransferase